MSALTDMQELLGGAPGAYRPGMEAGCAVMTGVQHTEAGDASHGGLL